METDNFQKLQQEAIRRAQEMQQQANRIQNAHLSLPLIIIIIPGSHIRSKGQNRQQGTYRSKKYPSLTFLSIPLRLQVLQTQICPLSLRKAPSQLF